MFSVNSRALVSRGSSENLVSGRPSKSESNVDVDFPRLGSKGENVLATEDSSVTGLQYSHKDALTTNNKALMKPNTSFSVKFGKRIETVSCNNREEVDDLRKRVSEIFGLNLSSYYIVSQHGVLRPGTLIDHYKLRERSSLILMRSGAHEAQMRASRDFWIKRREDRMKGRNTWQTDFRFSKLVKPTPTKRPQRLLKY